MKKSLYLHSLLWCSALTLLVGTIPREHVTELHLGRMGKLIESSYRRCEYPENLATLVAKKYGAILPDNMNRMSDINDDWGSAIVYRRLPTGYELRSSGRDGDLQTADDIVLIGPELPCDPQSLTVLAIEKVGKMIDSVSQLCEYPESLSDFSSSENGISVVKNNWPLSPWDDFWGQALVYKRLPTGFELRSIGGDGVPQTEDDIVMVWPSEPCDPDAFADNREPSEPIVEAEESADVRNSVPARALPSQQESESRGRRHSSWGCGCDHAGR